MGKTLKSAHSYYLLVKFLSFCYKLLTAGYQAVEAAKMLKRFDQSEKTWPVACGKFRRFGVIGLKLRTVGYKLRVA
ncbi:MAG: hypothetical protein BWY42_01015 [Candidatus Omnitrophica bacterium ADurb.Bin277]|nr:MAG: hypothetical protein BWY42_01015 [Candidatus Omnitrophica bacterium ADurb.Bin277]